jgi:hypothetical protein
MDANAEVWRATGQYMARKLIGIRATAPYLHNGSVPTRYHLPHPDRRPAKFLAGDREYDPATLAFQTQIAGTTVNSWDTGIRGCLTVLGAVAKTFSGDPARFNGCGSEGA